MYGWSLHQHLLQPAGPQRPPEEAGRQSGFLLVSVCLSSCPLMDASSALIVSGLVESEVFLQFGLTHRLDLS